MGIPLRKTAARCSECMRHCTRRINGNINVLMKSQTQRENRDLVGHCPVEWPTRLGSAPDLKTLVPGYRIKKNRRLTSNPGRNKQIQVSIEGCNCDRADNSQVIYVFFFSIYAVYNYPLNNSGEPSGHQISTVLQPKHLSYFGLSDRFSGLGWGFAQIKSADGSAVGSCYLDSNSTDITSGRPVYSAGC